MHSPKLWRHKSRPEQAREAKWGQFRKLLPWHPGVAWLSLRGSGARGACLVVSSKTEMAAITTQQGRNFDVSCRCCCCCSFLAYISSTLMIRKQFDEQGGQQRGRARSQMAAQGKAEPSRECPWLLSAHKYCNKHENYNFQRLDASALGSAVLQCRLLLATCHLALKHFAIYI